jgi:outer membrane protein TolC
MPSATELISASMPALVDMARAKRSERESLTERAEALRKGGDAAVAASRPQILAMAGVEESRPNPRFIPRSDEWRTSWEAGVSVTWQVFDGGRARAERTAAAAQATALTRRRDEFDGVLGVELRQRRGDVDAGRAAVDASAELVTAATELRRVLEERFRAGVATSMEVLDAQTSLLEAELERTRLMAALRISEVRLVRAVGMQ